MKDFSYSPPTTGLRITPEKIVFGNPAIFCRVVVTLQVENQIRKDKRIN